MIVQMLACLLFIFMDLQASSENFLLINGKTKEPILELGSSGDVPTTPCSTFKIVLSLMGYDAGILKDELNPQWEFQHGYDDFLEAWKAPQTPQSWMQCSCLWFSKVLALQLESKQIEDYLALFEYGNQDVSDGLLYPAWVNSSLKISPREQVEFIQRMLDGKLPISVHAIEMTKAILFKEELAEGWNLFGKTGWGGAIDDQDVDKYEIGWFVGWIEKDHLFLPFAYMIRAKKIDLTQRIPRVKELLSRFISAENAGKGNFVPIINAGCAIS